MAEHSIPGSPEQLRDLARSLEGGAKRLTSLRKQLDEFQHDDDWRGEAASAFRERAAGLPKRLWHAEARFRGTARALRPYAETLEEAQNLARQGRQDLDDARADVRRASEVRSREPTTMTNATVDRAQERVDTASGQIAHAQAMVERAADRCASAIAATIDDPLQDEDDGWMTELGRGLKGALKGLTEAAPAFLDDAGRFARTVGEEAYDFAAFWDTDTWKRTWTEFGKDFVAWDEWAAGRAQRALGVLAGNVLTLGITSFVRGLPGPRYLHSGPNRRWTPQGQGYDLSRDEILTTYYDQDDTKRDKPDIRGGVLLSIQDRVSGGESARVRLVGRDGTGGPAHGGGVSTDGEYVYVNGYGGELWVYDRTDIVNADPGDEVQALHQYDVEASSYSTIHDGRLYVGEFKRPPDVGVDKPPTFHSYDIGAGGAIDADKPRYEGETPFNSQGIAKYGDGFLFAQSHGEKPSELLYQPADGGAARTVGRLPPLAQEINVVGDELYVTSEANSYQFHVPDAPNAIEVYDLDDFDLER